jgi:O-antigen/teichoic acid export membrane protein
MSEPEGTPGRISGASPGSKPEPSPPGFAAASVRPTALVFTALAAGQILNFAALSLFSAWLGLEDFGKYGICLLDFTIFCNLANFALPAASVSMAVRGRFRDGVFSLAMGTRWWTSLAAVALYLLFEAAFRDGDMFVTALALAPAVLLNPIQVEWWFTARQSWRDLIIHRLLGGSVTLLAALVLVRRWPGLASAAAAYSAGAVAATVYLLVRASAAGKGLRLPWPRPGVPRMRWLWWKSLPLALTGTVDFLWLPLGYYAFRVAEGEGPLLGAYGASYRIIVAASLFASSLFMVLLPRFSARSAGSASNGGGSAPGEAGAMNASLRLTFDRMALLLAIPMLAVPFLARPLLTSLFPKTGWDAATLGYAAWALSAMALSTYLHLLRMPPLTRSLAAGASWAYCRRFFLAGLVNAAAVGIGVWSGATLWLPAWALAADLVFTGGWLATLHPGPGAGKWLRLAGLAAWSVFYLAWARHWA